MFHKITLIGNLGRDPEMRYTANAQAVTSFSLACNRVYTGNDGARVTETTWFRISVWGKQAESCNQYLKKGSKVYIEGRLASDPVTHGPRIYTRNDGTSAASYEVTATTVQFLSSRGEGETGEADVAGIEDESIPF